MYRNGRSASFFGVTMLIRFVLIGHCSWIQLIFSSQVNDTYRMATESINPRKATGSLHQLFISWAKFYEQPPEAVEPDVQSAREVLEKATTVPFKRVDDLAEVWIAWSEMEVRLENYDDARQVLSRATQVPRKTNINFHDEVSKNYTSTVKVQS